MEIEVTRPIEDALGSVSGLKNLSSRSQDSVSVVSIEFRDGEDVFSKLPEIREKLNIAADKLPEGISGEPEIYIHDAGSLMPVYSIMVYSTLPGDTFTEFIKNDFKSGITRIDGVSNVNIYGGQEKELEIRLILMKLKQGAWLFLISTVSCSITTSLCPQELSATGGKTSMSGHRESSPVSPRLKILL